MNSAQLTEPAGNQPTNSDPLSPDKILDIHKLGHPRNGRIAKLPKEQREELNQMLADGATSGDSIMNPGPGQRPASYQPRPNGLGSPAANRMQANGLLHPEFTPLLLPQIGYFTHPLRIAYAPLSHQVQKKSHQKPQ